MLSTIFRTVDEWKKNGFWLVTNRERELIKPSKILHVLSVMMMITLRVKPSLELASIFSGLEDKM